MEKSLQHLSDKTEFAESNDLAEQIAQGHEVATAGERVFRAKQNAAENFARSASTLSSI